MTTSHEPVGVPTATPDRCPPNCPECATASADDWDELVAESEAFLAQHDETCVAEAIQDAFDSGTDEEQGVRFVAWQLLDDGYSPCRCGSLTEGATG